jgi:hypothetical protein
MVCFLDRAKPEGHNERWREKAFTWPDQAGKAVEAIAKARVTHDVYFCSSLMATPRRKGEACNVHTLSFELDAPPADSEVFDNLKATTVRSGTDGHQHVYVHLANPMDPGQARTLSMALARQLGVQGTSGGKWEPNALLRVPGTFNHKTDPPTRVRLSRLSRRRHRARALRLLVRPESLEPSNDTDATVPDAEPVNWSRLHDGVRAAFERTSGDRSDNTYGLVAACREHGYTKGQAVTVVSEYPPAVEKFGWRADGVAGEVATIWAKLESEKPLATPPGEWEDPIPLTRQPEPIPVDALGPVLGPLVTAFADAYQVPSDLVVNLALPLITTAARGKWLVKINDSWTESLCLATVSAAASGERKSAIVRALSEPLRRAERNAGIAARTTIAEQEAAREVKQHEVDQLKKDAARGDLEKTERYLRAAADLKKLEVSKPPRFIVDDVTPEKLAHLLGEQNGSLGVISSEATLLHIMAGRHSGKPNLEVVLQATSGDPIRVDRQSRESISIEHTALSLGLCIQPKLLSAFGQGPYRDSGLLARFLYVLPEPRVGTRSSEESSVPPSVSERWARALMSIVDAAASSGAREEDDSVDIVDVFRHVRFDSTAARRFRAFREWIEPRLHPHHGELAAIGDWGSKLPGAVTRIAGALTLLDDVHATTVSGDTMADAVRIGRAYVDHAMAAFGLIHTRSDELWRADEVLGWIRKNGAGVVSVRDVHRAVEKRSWVRGVEDVKNTFYTLQEYGHVRKIEKKTGRGRPSERYEVNPKSIDNIDNIQKNALIVNNDNKSRRAKYVDKNDKNGRAPAREPDDEDDRFARDPVCELEPATKKWLDFTHVRDRKKVQR